jgi:hypothetical protein
MRRPLRPLRAVRKLRWKLMFLASWHLDRRPPPKGYREEDGWHSSRPYN